MNLSREAYIDFLKAKIPKAELAGFEPPSPCHESLRPDQRDIAEWAMDREWEQALATRSRK